MLHFVWCTLYIYIRDIFDVYTNWGQPKNLNSRSEWQTLTLTELHISVVSMIGVKATLC